MKALSQRLVAGFAGVAASVALLGLGVSLLLPSWIGEESGPKMARISPERHDFGKVRQSESLTHVFRLENISDKTLEIAGYYLTCKCTELPDGLLERQLSPGETVDIPVTMTTGASGERVAASASFFLRPVGGSASDVEVVEAELTALVQPEFRRNQLSNKLALSQLRDGLSETILMVEDAGRPQRWTLGRPRPDLAVIGSEWAPPKNLVVLDGDNKGGCLVQCDNRGGIYSFHSGGANVVFADGHVELLSKEIDPREVIRLIHPSDSDPTFHNVLEVAE